AVRWEAGQQCWVVTTVGVDISDRKRHELERQQYEAALAQSEAKFRSLVENASEITYARSLNGNLLYISPQVEAVLGYKPEDLIGQNILDRLVHPDDRAMVDAAAADLVVTGQSQRALEVRLRHRDGHWHWLRSNTSAIVNDAGAVVGIQGMSADIHDQKLAEQALQESRARFEAIYAQAAVGISLAALPSGQIILVNQCFCDFVGYSQQELLQMSYLDYTHPDDWQQDEALMTQLMTGEIEHFTLEKRFVRPSGEVRWGALTVSLVKDAEGHPLYDIAIIQDITERRQWQQAVEESQASVRRSEERLRTAMEAANMGSWHWHLDTNEVVWSETLERVMGLDPGSFDGRMETVVAMIYPADRSRVAAAIDRSLHLGIAYDIEFRFIRPDGTLRWAATKGNSIRNGEGRVIAMAGVDIDITDRKRAEAALQESEARFRQLADTVREGFFVFEVRDDRYSYVNPAYLAITGLAEAQVYGGGNPWVQGIHPGDRDRVDILMQQELQGRPGEAEYRFQRPDGTECWLRSQSFPIPDDSGTVVRIVGTVADISDRKQAEISLQRNNTLLRAISAAQTQFITNADPGLLFDNLLETLLALTDSEYGFIGEILYTADGQAYVDESYMKMRGRPYLKTKAITNIAWNEETRRFYDEQAPHGMEFHNLKTLFGQVMVTGEPVIANHPSTDPRRGGVPDGHPPLNAFLGVPFFRGDQLVGMVGLANRPEGYDESIIDELGPFLTTCGSTIEAYRNEIKRQQAERALQRFNEELEQRVQRRTAALHQSEQDLRTIFNNVYDAIFIHDIDGTILDVNDRALALMGATREQLLTATVADLTAVPDLGAQAAAYLARAHAGESLQFEWSVRRFDHPSRFEAEVSLRGGTLGNRPVVIASVRDISDRKRLQAEQTRLLNILEAAPDHIGIATPDGTIIWNNRQAKLLRGLPLDTDPGQLSIEIYHPPWATAIICQEGIPTARAEGIWMGETALLTADGEELPVSQIILAHHSPTGAVEYLSTIIRDISPLKVAETALRRINADLETRVTERTVELLAAKEAAEAASHAKSTFLANMSHELRTPLNAILGFSQLMGRDRTLSVQQLENLNIINRSGEHLLTLINDILEMSKIEAGQATLDPNGFDLIQLLHDLGDMLRLKAEAKALAFTTECHPQLPRYIHTDSHKLRQVLLNLLSNAIKFTSVGYVVLRVQPGDLIHLGAPPPAPLATPPDTLQVLHFEVEDSGIGIAPEELDLLFEPFGQTASGRQSQEGTGLGVPISRQFVTLLGGTLAVASTPSVGSTFSFDIPIQVSSSDGVTAAPALQAAIAIAPDQPTYRILVVEDNWTNRVLLHNLLADLGFEVTTALNGQEAIHRWQDWQPHLIFMDLRMPVMNGYDATRTIRQLEQADPDRYPTPTKIISLTAGVFENDLLQLQEIGFDDGLCKPVEANTLTSLISHHLGVRYLYDQRATVATATPPILLTADLLQALPHPWLQRFYTAMTLLEQEGMLALIDELPADQAAIAQVLRHKVENFDYEPLFTLLQGHLIPE
ncbi:MAG: PAS domain S-box protein, partial [Leptolyngbya sp.]|nr:PAS domain S-box protein [Leptolyngbya sp.]